MDTENTPEISTQHPKKLLVYAIVAIIILIVGYIAYSLLSAKVLARDAKRQADIMQIASALELYANDHKSYPQNLDELLGKDKSGPYLSGMPVPPKPADGPCSNEQNHYSYNRLNPLGYELKYCLGQKRGSQEIFFPDKLKPPRLAYKQSTEYINSHISIE